MRDSLMRKSAKKDRVVEPSELGANVEPHRPITITIEQNLLQVTAFWELSSWGTGARGAATRTDRGSPPVLLVMP